MRPFAAVTLAPVLGNTVSYALPASFPLSIRIPSLMRSTP
jgi:hypothetical protein